MDNDAGLSSIEWMLEGNSADTFTSNDDLITATQKGNFLRVSALLSGPEDEGSEQIDVNETDEDGRCALYYAANGQLKIAEKLVQHGADVNHRDTYMTTPIHRAVQGHLKILAMFIENGADIVAVNEWGYTPLHEASLGGHWKCVEVLLTKKADVNQQNDYGDAPLHFACQKGHDKVVMSLLMFKAAKNLQNDAGKLPLDVAKEKGYEDVIKLLESPDAVQVINLDKKKSESMFDYLEEVELVEDQKNIKIMISTPSMRDLDVQDHDEPQEKPRAQKRLDVGTGALLIPARQKKKTKQKSKTPKSYTRLYENDVWEMCRTILQEKDVSDWADVRSKLKIRISKEQWAAVKDSDDIIKMKRRCRKYFDGNAPLEKVRPHKPRRADSEKRRKKRIQHNDDGISINISTTYDSPPDGTHPKSSTDSPRRSKTSSPKHKVGSPRKHTSDRQRGHSDVKVVKKKSQKLKKQRNSDKKIPNFEEMVVEEKRFDVDPNGREARSSSRHRRRSERSKSVKRRHKKKKDAVRRAMSEKRPKRKKEKMSLTEILSQAQPQEHMKTIPQESV